jgi:MFS family permease
MSAESESPKRSGPPKAGPFTFAGIFALESFARSLNATVISLQSYDILGSSQKVSVLSTSVSLAVMTTTLLMPLILGRLPRRLAYSLGAALLAIASLLLATHTIVGQWAGIYTRNGGAAIFNVVLSLYILDNIPRHELTRTEPIRLSLSTISWMSGPALGVWLYVSYGPFGPQIAVLASLALLLAVFWSLRLHEGVAAKAAPFRPVSNVRRFVKQPRLRLAWTIAFGRSCFWSVLFTYGPLLMVESGLGKSFIGFVISATQALLLAAYLSGSLARRFGVRRVIAGCFGLAALAAIIAGFAGTHFPYVAVGMLLAGSFAAAGLDGVGGIPFLRAVRPHERQRMAAVYRTFIDFSDLIPSFIFAIALLWLPIGAVFVILGSGLAVVGFISWRYLPKTM